MAPFRSGTPIITTAATCRPLSGLSLLCGWCLWRGATHGTLRCRHLVCPAGLSMFFFVQHGAPAHGSVLSSHGDSLVDARRGRPVASRRPIGCAPMCARTFGIVGKESVSSSSAS